ncbi:23S rRNA (guanosine(2251)-2'-O)-methyltransferase RlmB [Oscillospiraceae bacterium OttesenSCG-928-F05]|nr:23S rRNA (guanosine(2251)-2'-O)-methyltransferase RlmB [Oscillospiraceae bacterium OttesenSCG-928-F05]
MGGHSRDRGHGGGPRDPDHTPAADGVLEGRNPVLEALNAGRQIDKLYVSAERRDAALSNLIFRAKEAGAVVISLERRKLDQMSTTRNHQGIIAHMPARTYEDAEALVEAALRRDTPPLFVVCDGITDTQNLGAIIRTAEAAGADGIIVRERRSAGLTAAVSRASAGALEHMPVARVPNIPAFLKRLQKDGFWIYGAAGGTAQTIWETDFKGAAALVIGSEGEGLPRLTAETCDFIVSVPMFGHVSSLNASAAAAVILYEIARQRAAL